MAEPVERINLSVRIDGLKMVQGRFAQIPAKIKRGLAQATAEAVTLVRDRARENVAANFRNPTTMQEAIHDYLEYSGSGIPRGRVIAEGLPYLKIQEMGGTIQIPEIFPHGSALKFVGEFGEDVFAKHTAAHEVTIPARPYMQPAFEDSRDEIRQMFAEVLGDI